jgi:hypothetical protein
MTTIQLYTSVTDMVGSAWFCLEGDCQVAEPLCHVKVSGSDSQLEQDKSFLCDVKVSALVSESEQDKSLLCDVKDKKRDNSDTVQKAWEDIG